MALFTIYGYYKDDKESIDGYIVKDSIDVDNDDEDIFFYFNSEEHIMQCIADGKKTKNDFVITAYEIYL